MNIDKTDHTPLMKQYHEIKEQYPHLLLLFQVGDFYELFYEDAKQAAACLGIALTARGKNKGEPIPLCGVPIHAIDHYVSKLIKNGFRVAFCDQLEEPKPGTVVKRGVTKILSPGMLTDDQHLNAQSPSYLFTFCASDKNWGIIAAELMTGQLLGTVLPTQERVLEAELNRFFPDEVILTQNGQIKYFMNYFKQQGYFTTTIDLTEQKEQRIEWVEKRLPTINDNKELLQSTLSSLYLYLNKQHISCLDQFQAISLYSPREFLQLDAMTQRNLELFRSNNDEENSSTLFSSINNSKTAMGARLIKKWLTRPLLNKKHIDERLDIVQEFFNHSLTLHELRSLLHELGDIERIVGRIALQRASLHDYRTLAKALELIPIIKSILNTIATDKISLIGDALDLCIEVKQLLGAAINTDTLRDWYIKEGFNEKLDSMRMVIGSSNQKLVELERNEQKRTGINSLKVSYNSVHGYYIEITKTHLDLVPSNYIRLQTLVGKERYITPQLQQIQYEITQAQQEIISYEKNVYEQIKQQVISNVSRLRKLAHVLANLDALTSFADNALRFNYVRPEIGSNLDLIIENGRHPVIERTTHSSFIANETYLTQEKPVWIITGPNMGGKSTYLRQVALTTILAHCGSFVPAKKAQIPITDRIFTRIGAGDNLSKGKSTFLVEMEETALVCAQATEKSLIILDEVGRGTSTYDGLSIAQAVVEYILHTIKAKCLFATHYFELTKLAQHYPVIINYHAASKQTTHGIVFLYKIIPGIAQGSFGLDVARLAKLPPVVIKRAQEILESLSEQESLENTQIIYKPVHVDHPALEELRSLSCDELTPRQALDKLYELKLKSKNI